MAESTKNVVNTIEYATFLNLTDDTKSTFYFLRNKNGMLAAITNCGCNLISLLVPDAEGRLVEVIGGCENFDGSSDFTFPHLIKKAKPFNSFIAQDKFSEKDYLKYLRHRLKALNTNVKGLKDLLWKAGQPNNTTLELTCYSTDSNYDSPDVPDLRITYTLSGDNGIKVNRETTFNEEGKPRFANSIFFNLNGAGSGSVLNHIVQINADNYIPVSCNSMQVFEVETVSTTPFDFRKATAIGARINDNNEQLRTCHGYNHNFVLNKHTNRTPVARVKGDKSGIIMEVCTEDPYLLFCSGELKPIKNDINESKQDGSRIAFTIEAQHLPDAADQEEFKVRLLNAGQIYKSVTIYRFKTGDQISH